MGVTLITGASSGIGRSLARRLAMQGEATALVARRTDLLNSLVEEIEQAGGSALALTCDVTDREQVIAAVREAESKLGPVTRLVANAGGGSPTFVDQFDAREVADTIQLNLVAVAYCIEAVLPGMLARADGHLVAVGSLAGIRGLPTAAAYSAAKAGLTNLMESLRIDLRPHGIAVTLLLPGFVQTKAHKPRRPLQLDLEKATQHMVRAIQDRKPCLSLPWALSLAFAVLRLLPSAVYDRLLAGRGRRHKTKVRVD